MNADKKHSDDARLMLVDLTKTYYDLRAGQHVQAVVDLSAEIAAGEFVAVVGPSGCGKSTLLRMIAGLTPPTSGHVLHDGELVDRPSPERGVIFQHYALFPWKSVKQNVEFGPRCRGWSSTRIREVTEYYVHLVGLQGFEDKYPHELSGGMQQRCALARLFANDPEVLLMDEPLAAVDELTRRTLQEELINIWAVRTSDSAASKGADERKTVVYVTHSVEEAVFLADRVIVMTQRPGRIKRALDIGVPRPRVEYRSDPRIAEYADEIWLTLRSPSR